MVIRQIKVRSRDQEVMTYVPASRCGLKRAPSRDQPDSGVPVFQRKAHLGIGQDREEALWQHYTCNPPRQTPQLHTPGAEDLLPVIAPQIFSMNISLCSNQTIRKASDQHLLARTHCISWKDVELTSSADKVGTWQDQSASQAPPMLMGTRAPEDQPERPQGHPRTGAETWVESSSTASPESNLTPDMGPGLRSSGLKWAILPVPLPSKEPLHLTQNINWLWTQTSDQLITKW